MRVPATLALILAATALQGCLARAAVDVVTLPVKAVSKGVDVATTSQSEADEKRGREISKREERLARIEREYGKQIGRCQNGDAEACEEAQALKAKWEALLPTVPVEPDED
jgi:DNA repair ATPase RecN